MTLDIKNCDCMELMKEYPDKHFDLAIVDPPYGIGFDREYISMTLGIRKDGTRRHDKTWKNKPSVALYKTKQWDKKPSKAYFDLLFKISKNQIIFGGNYFTDILPVSGGWIVWDKGMHEKMTLSQCELAWTQCLNSIKIFRVLWSGYKKENPEEKRIHPTQKPVALYEWLLTKYAKKGDKILDTHMGSGSIAIACHNLGFDLTACELDKDYYDAAMKRISYNTKQKPLFNLNEIFINSV